MKEVICHQSATDIIRNKIVMEEETLQLLIRTGLEAENQVVHDQMICIQQQIINYYKDLLEKVSISTIVH